MLVSFWFFLTLIWINVINHMMHSVDTSIGSAVAPGGPCRRSTWPSIVLEFYLVSCHSQFFTLPHGAEQKPLVPLPRGPCHMLMPMPGRHTAELRPHQPPVSLVTGSAPLPCLCVASKRLCQFRLLVSTDACVHDDRL